MTNKNKVVISCMIEDNTIPDGELSIEKSFYIYNSTFQDIFPIITGMDCEKLDSNIGCGKCMIDI